MKKTYEKPELEVVKLEVEDVIATSDPGTTTPDDEF